MISIIGRAGFIGTNIVKCLSQKYEFKILDNGFNNSGHLEFEHLEIELLPIKIIRAIKGSDVVINLAGHTSFESIEDPL